jgi:hypothetical protein
MEHFGNDNPEEKVKKHIPAKLPGGVRRQHKS